MMDKMMRKVLITGVLGQDGANMAEFLLRLPQYKVYGMMRRSANPNFSNAKNFKDLILSKMNNDPYYLLSKETLRSC